MIGGEEVGGMGIVIAVHEEAGADPASDGDPKGAMIKSSRVRANRIVFLEALLAKSMSNPFRDGFVGKT